MRGLTPIGISASTLFPSWRSDWSGHSLRSYASLLTCEISEEPAAPIGFNEVRAVVPDCETILDLTEDDLNALLARISCVLRRYELTGYNSFNLALYSGSLNNSRGCRVPLSMITRAAMLPYYRSDAMHMERLHWEAAVDRAPERIAQDCNHSNLSYGTRLKLPRNGCAKIVWSPEINTKTA
jgi:hypothetical protein